MNTPACTKCPLHKDAINIKVPGRGSDDPLIMFVAVAPGYSGDKNNESISGKPGKKLSELLANAGIDEDNCRFTNLVRCVPWVNPKAEKKKTRDPVDEEIASCQNYLLKEIALYEPNIIVPLGKVATAYFLTKQKNIKISQVSGNSYNWEHPISEEVYTIIPTLHPSAVLSSDHWLGKVNGALQYAQKLATGKSVEDIFDECEYEYLDTIEKLEDYVDKVIAKYEADPDDPLNVVSIDVETAFKDPLPEDYPIEPLAVLLNAFNPFHMLVSVQFSHAPKKGAFVPLWHIDSPFKDYASIARIASAIQRLVDVVPVIGQNFKFDYKILYVMLGVTVKKFFFDSLLVQFLVYQKSQPLNLEDMAGLYVEMPFFKREMHKALADLDEEIRHMGNVELDKLIRYGCGDADAVMRLLHYWYPILVENGLWEVYQDILRDATVSYARVEINGMMIDKDRLSKLEVDYTKELKELLHKVRKSDYI
ncbi:MAG: uracil-DNA glycosylase family protein, partial [Candidatus Thorarchaeota archaeon]